MAMAGFYSPPATVTVVPPESQSVWVRWSWSAAWTWVPGAKALSAEEAACPGVGAASIEFQYGYIIDNSGAGYVLPGSLRGAYVAIVNHNYWGAWHLWTGVIEEEEIEPDAYAAYPSGVIRWTAYELSHVLDRIYIDQTVTEAGAIGRGLTFNSRSRRGLGTWGNRSDAVAANGAYTFSQDGNQWTNGQIVYYLLQNFCQTGGISWGLAGDLNSLNQLVEQHDLMGMSVKAALDELVSRKRGLGWRVVATESAATIFVFTQLAETLAFPSGEAGLQVSANPFQAVVDVSGVLQRPVYNFRELERYDEIHVRGGRVGVCCTLSIADGTLEEGWTSGEESAYQTGTSGGTGTNEEKDTARGADKWGHVFTKFNVPAAWDWRAGDGEGGTKYLANPRVMADASLDTSLADVIGGLEYGFERELPFVEEGTAAGYESRRREWFALLQDDDDDWHYVEKLSEVKLRNCAIQVADGELALYVRGNPNHAIGLNHFTSEDTETPPEVDYETLVATVFLYTDAEVRCTYSLPAGGGQRDVPRVKQIDLPDAEIWYVVPGTVVDVVDGALQRYEDKWPGQGYVFRDDGEKVRAAALLAAAWFGQERNLVTIESARTEVAYPAGVLILGAVGAWNATPVRAVVTSRMWDFETGTTTYQTGYEELDFAGWESRAQRKVERAAASGQATIAGGAPGIRVPVYGLSKLPRHVPN